MYTAINYVANIRS